MRTLFIGHFLEALRVVHQRTELTLALGEEGKTPPEIRAYCEKNNVPLRLVRHTADMEAVFQAPERQGKTLFSAGCGLLFSQRIIDACGLVVNFHPGDVFTCRGRHPLPVAICKRLPLMAFSAHVIDSEKIDAGPLIAQFFLPIDYQASYADNEKRLRNGLPGFVSHVIDMLDRNECVLWENWHKTCKSPYNAAVDAATLQRIFSAEHIGQL